MTYLSDIFEKPMVYKEFRIPLETDDLSIGTIWKNESSIFDDYYIMRYDGWNHTVYSRVIEQIDEPDFSFKDLIVWYPFNNCLGNQITDMSGKNNHGSIVTGSIVADIVPIFKSASRNYKLEDPGNITIPINQEITKNEFTLFISGSLKHKGVSKGGRYDVQLFNFDDIFVFYYHGGSYETKPDVYTSIFKTSFDLLGVSTSLVTERTTDYESIIITYNGSQCVIYKNGNFNNSIINDTYDFTSKTNFILNTSSSDGWKWVENINNIQLYNRCLTPEEVSNLSNIIY